MCSSNPSIVRCKLRHQVKGSRNPVSSGNNFCLKHARFWKATPGSDFFRALAMMLSFFSNPIFVTFGRIVKQRCKDKYGIVDEIGVVIQSQCDFGNFQAMLQVAIQPIVVM